MRITSFVRLQDGSARKKKRFVAGYVKIMSREIVRMGVADLEDFVIHREKRSLFLKNNGKISLIK
jgi:hypothetical protein